MSIKIVVSRDAGGFIKVLASVPGVLVMVLDAAVEPGDACIEVAGNPAALASLVDGLPRVAPDTVQSLFEEVGQRLAELPRSPLRTQQANVQLLNFKRNAFGFSPTAPGIDSAD